MTEDTEIILTHGDWKATVAPLGASLRGLTWRGEPVITGYSGKENKVGGQGDVLIPFPGRVKNGAYTFDGQHYQMPQNDKDGPNAIHGFLRNAVWEVISDGTRPNEGSFRTRLDGEAGYPFSLVATVDYILYNEEFECDFYIENVGDTTAPVGAGFHPYFTVGSDLIDGDTLHVPMASVLEFDDKLVPTGNILPVAGTEWDFTSPRQIGATQFNTCYANPTRDEDGRFSVALSNAERRVTIEMDYWFNYVVLYSGDPLPESHSRRALAIEPMTCGSDAFNHPEWGLKRLEPGKVTSAGWSVQVSTP